MKAQPSGGDSITYFAAIMPPWPALFSTTQGWPRCGCSQSQKMRATMSFGPPARKPTTNLIGRVGNFSAAVAAPSSGPQTTPNSNAMKRTACITKASLAPPGSDHARTAQGKSEPAFGHRDCVTRPHRHPHRQLVAGRGALHLPRDLDLVPVGARREPARNGDGVLDRHVGHVR